MDRICSLGSTEHAEIFRILKNHGIGHTKNKNGVFIDITSVADDVIKKVSDFVTFCATNNKELEEYDKRLNQCKLYQNIDCMTDPAVSKNKSCNNNNMQRFFESLEHGLDAKKHLLPSSTKYLAARKKYSKKVMVDVTRTRGGIDEVSHELKEEAYLI
jgi:pSer/pThr/pTyr-binding forkhead associated (FHA) protein